MQKYAILVLTDSTEPADRGRMVHAAHLSTELREAGADVKLVFCGKGVTWVPAFGNRDAEDAHPFVKAYGHHFEHAQDHIEVCNMCSIRFKVKEEVETLGFPIIGEGRSHMPLGNLVQEGYQVITF